jgi:hypothetical protein
MSARETGAGELKPVDMMLFCPKCGFQHVDAPTPDWTNPPHRSHLCHECGCVWRPADVPTNGVAGIQTFGAADTVFYNRAALSRPQPTPAGEIVERLLADAANLERDIEPGEPNEDVYRATVARIRAYATTFEQQAATIAEFVVDKERLDWLQSESDDLLCFSIPTGGGDADVGWRVVGHYMGEPENRVIAEVYHDDLRAAIDEARAALAKHGPYSDVFLTHPASRATLERTRGQ